MIQNFYERVSKSSTVWLFKKESKKIGSYDYTINMLRRSKDANYGKYWAHSGGIQEDQDNVENWVDYFPHFVEKNYMYNDLASRICCLRHLFRECSILPSYSYEKFGVVTKNSFLKTDESSSSFASTLSKKNIMPAVDKLKAFRRISTPYGAQNPKLDTQTYFYFMENDEVSKIDLNRKELDSSSLMSPNQILKDFYLNKKRLFFPQIFTLLWIAQFKSYDELKYQMDNVQDQSIMSYMEFRGNIFMNYPIKMHSSVKDKIVENDYTSIFNKFDFLSDDQRKDVFDLKILNETADCAQYSGLQYLGPESQKFTGQDLFQHYGADL